MSLPTCFTALDFETGNASRASICAVGLVRVERGRTVRALQRLIRPPDNQIWSRYTAIHGIRWQDTRAAPTFADLWEELRPWLEGEVVVAHNFGFDGSCLRAVLDHYGLPHPDFTPDCTYRIYRRNLASLCVEHAIPLEHHNALSDAMACAELYRRHLERLATGDPR